MQSPIRKSPQQIQVFMFKVIWLPTFHSLNAQTHPICTDASTVIIYWLVSVHDQMKCLMTNINMTSDVNIPKVDKNTLFKGIQKPNQNA